MEVFGPELFGEGLELRITVAGRNELQERHFEVSREGYETVNRNTVRALFIFLYLLEGQIQVLRDFDLTFAGGTTGDAQIAPQFAVERTIGQAFGFSGHSTNHRSVARRFKDRD